MSAPVAELRGVSLRLGEQVLFEDLSLRVARDDKLALVGDNGAGKSTLLDLLVGLRRPDRGAVEVLGRPPPSPDVGFVPQNAAASLLPWLSARDNVGLLLRARGAGRREIDRRLLETRALLDPDETVDLDAYPETLSGGQRQLVALMRALIASPDLLVCDEPASALDGATRARLRCALQTLASTPSGPALIVVTHDPKDVEGVADRTMRLSGRPARLDREREVG